MKLYSVEVGIIRQCLCCRTVTVSSSSAKFNFYFTSVCFLLHLYYSVLFCRAFWGLRFVGFRSPTSIVVGGFLAHRKSHVDTLYIAGATSPICNRLAVQYFDRCDSEERSQGLASTTSVLKVLCSPTPDYSEEVTLLQVGIPCFIWGTTCCNLYTNQLLSFLHRTFPKIAATPYLLY